MQPPYLRADKLQYITRFDFIFAHVFKKLFWALTIAETPKHYIFSNSKDPGEKKNGSLILILAQWFIKHKISVKIH